MKKVTSAFGVVSIILLILTFFVFHQESAFLAKAVQAKGQVIGYQTSSGHDANNNTQLMYAPIIVFKTKDNQVINFTSDLSSSSRSYAVNTIVPVLYDANNPQSADIDSLMNNWFPTLILSVIAVVFSLMTILLIMLARKNSRKIDHAKFSRTITSKYKGVKVNSRLVVNGESPFQIISQWFDQANNSVYEFLSPNIWFDPSDYIKDKQDIKVCVKPGNLKKYKMDISFLPEKS